MVRLWSHEAFAHGAEVVSYFRWRQAPFAQEQFHAALNRPDGSPDQAYFEASSVKRELADLPSAETQRSGVALIFDYPSQWASEIQPQGQDFDGFAHVMTWYRGLRLLGQNIDILPSNADLSGYALVVVPHLFMPDLDFVQAVERKRRSGCIWCTLRITHHQPSNSGRSGTGFAAGIVSDTGAAGRKSASRG